MYQLFLQLTTFKPSNGPDTKPVYWSDLRVVLILVLLLFSLTRCGKLDPTAPTSGTFSSVYQAIQDNNCVQCHKPSGSATIDNGVTLDFSSQTRAYQTLISGTVSGITSSGICSGVNIIVSGSPATSYLTSQLFSDYRMNNFGGVSGCSPYSGHSVNLSSSERASVLKWIQDGALNN